MSPSQRISQLLKRFKLSPKATQGELKAAYLKQAKVLHPDVAGEESGEDFRKLKDEYEEAMKLLRDGTSPYSPGSTASSASQSGQHYHGNYQHWAPPPRPPPGRKPPPPPEPLTPAQRIRNALLAAGGVIFVTLMISRESDAVGRLSPGAVAADSAAAAAVAAGTAGAVGAAAVAATGGVPLEPRERRQVSDYYKSRSSKSSVRVRGSDVYVSSTEARTPAEPASGPREPAAAPPAPPAPRQDSTS